MKIITRHYFKGKFISEDVLNINGNHSNCPEVIIQEYEINNDDLPILGLTTQQPTGLATVINTYSSKDDRKQHHEFVSTQVPDSPKGKPILSKLFVRGNEKLKNLPQEFKNTLDEKYHPRQRTQDIKLSTNQTSRFILKSRSPSVSSDDQINYEEKFNVEQSDLLYHDKDNYNIIDNDEIKDEENKSVISSIYEDEYQHEGTDLDTPISSSRKVEEICATSDFSTDIEGKKN